MGTLFDALQLFPAGIVIFLVFAKYFLLTALLVFQCRIPVAQQLSLLIHPGPRFIPHLNLVGPICVFCFHLPTNRFHTLPIDKETRSAAEKLLCVHISNKQ